MGGHPAVRAGQEDCSHPSQPSHGAAEAEGGGPDGGGKQFTGVEIYRVEVGRRSELPCQSETDPEAGGASWDD